MTLTPKERKALETAKHNAAVAWSRACLEANVPSNSPFVVFEHSKPMAKASNEAALGYAKVYARIKKNVARRERNQMMRDLGLTRGTASDGRTIWE
jgi:hypothetical protein